MVKKVLLTVAGLAVILVLSISVLAIVGSVAHPSPAGRRLASCSLPSNDVVMTTADICRKLNGEIAGPDESKADLLYALWKSNNRTNHNRAFGAANTYLIRFPQGRHAPELQVWCKAYQDVVRALTEGSANASLSSYP